MKKIKKFQPTKTQSAVAFSVLSIALIIGGYFIFRSRAAQPAASIEADGGSVVSPAKIEPDSNASSGQIIKFEAITPPDPSGNCPLNTYAGVPPADGIINGVRTRPDDPNAIDACRAGVSRGVSLTSISSSAFTNLIKPGVTLSGYKVNGCVKYDEINDVTIKETEINCSAPDGDPGISYGNSNKITVDHVTIRASSKTYSVYCDFGVVGYGSMTVTNTLIDGCTNGIESNVYLVSSPKVTLLNNAIINVLGGTGSFDAHNDGIKIDKQTGSTLIKYNYVDYTGGDTSSLTINVASGTVEQNWFIGGGYTVYPWPSPGQTQTYRYNRVGKGHFNYWYVGGGGTVNCTDNVIQSTGVKFNGCSNP